MGKENDVKFYLHDLKHVNTVLGMLYDENGKYRAGFSPEEFYNTILLDTLKFGEENYVHLKYAETVNISKSQSVARFRRWAGMTPVIRPLVEGMPPAPDKHAYEYIECGNVFSFGRWSEYTDQIDTSVVSDLLAERTSQYGENANQTKELYARKEWLSSPNEYFANFKSGINELTFGDDITIDDLRFLTMRMKRAQVKPIGGKFNYICSPEFINNLLDDPRVVQYMKLNQTTGNMWTTGEAVPLFDLNFIPTMLDEFAYPDTEFPGVYEKADGTEVMRVYAFNDDKTELYIVDVHQDFVTGTNKKAKMNEAGVTYLADGTAVENKVTWNIPALTLDATDSTGNCIIIKQGDTSTEATSTKCILRQYKVSLIDTSNVDYIPVGTKFKFTLAASTETVTVTNPNTAMSNGEFMQLPIHRGILFGDEAMIKINKEGLSDQPRIIVKALGSSGVNDPMDQRQSIAYRVDGFGLAIKRPEAICVTYSVPTHAEMATLTAQYINQGAENRLEYEGEYIQDRAGNNIQAMVVDAINNPFDVSIGTKLVDALNKYALLKVGTSYNVNDLVQAGGVAYKVNTAISNASISALANSTAYYVGDVVVSNSKYYVALDNFTTDASTTITENSWREATDAEVAVALAKKYKANLKKDNDKLFENLFSLINEKEDDDGNKINHR